MDSLAPDTLNVVVAAARDVEVTVNRKVWAGMRLILFPSASDLDLNVLLGDQDRFIRNVLVEHNERTAAMRLHKPSAALKMPR